MFRSFDAKRFAVGEKSLHEFFRVFADADVFRGGVSDDAVVDVSEIHDVVQAKAAKLQETPQNVLEDESAVVPNMRVVVDRGAASVHCDFAGLLRDERFSLVGESIVEADFHGRQL